jgi:fructose/tagatose bisphosphate aldolase
MLLVSLRPLLDATQAGGYAVGAVTTIDHDVAQAVIEAAELAQAPMAAALIAANAASDSNSGDCALRTPRTPGEFRCR